MSESTNIIYKTIQVEKEKTVGELLIELKIDGKYFAILLNGKRVELDKVIDPKDKIIVLPKIKGGKGGLH